LLEGCHDKCKHKDVMCNKCIDGEYFDFDAQD